MAVLYSFVIFVDGSARLVSPTDTLDGLPER
jgi:hypothetical protein